MYAALFVGTILVFDYCSADSFTFCKYSDPNSDKCLAESIEKALQQIKSGLPNYGLKSLDPFLMDHFTIDAGKGAVQLVEYYKDVQVSGFSDVTVKSANFDPVKKVLKFISNHPKIIQEGHYKVDGKILSLAVVGEGQSKLVLDDVQIMFALHFEEITKNGEKYYKVKSCKVDFLPGKVTFNFENLFNGNKLLADNILAVMNEEWATLFNDVKPSINRNYGQLFKEYSQPFFGRVPAEKVFMK